MRPPMKHGRQSGFALLLVFLLAALLALSLYMEIPRVAFETQRQKEQLLVERGEQYKRAIKLYVSPKGIGRWPAKIEDLENTNNRRFLRHRYLDPFTGKDDWRLIHVQNGVLTDSAVNKLKNPADQKDASSGAVQSSVGTLSSVSAIPDGSGNSGQQNLNLAALRRRTSEGGTNPSIIGPDGQPVPGGTPAIGPDGQPYPGTQPYPGSQQAYPGSQQPYPGSQQAYPGSQQPYPGSQQAYPGSQQPYPGSQQAYPGSQQPYPGSQQAFPGSQPYPGSQPNPGLSPNGQVQPYPGMPIPAGGQPGQYPGMPGPPVNSQTGGVSPTPYPTQPGSQGQSPYFGQPGMQGTNPAQQAAAAAIINQILMTPNPRGLAGVQGAMGNLMGAGIAGVGLPSTMDDESIMLYNDRSNYKEWEFVYDPTKERPLPNPNGGAAIGTSASQIGSGFAPGPAPGGAGASMIPPGQTTGTTTAPKQ